MTADADGAQSPEGEATDEQTTDEQTTDEQTTGEQTPEDAAATGEGENAADVTAPAPDQPATQTTADEVPASTGRAPETPTTDEQATEQASPADSAEATAEMEAPAAAAPVAAAGETTTAELAATKQALAEAEAAMKDREATLKAELAAVEEEQARLVERSNRRIAELEAQLEAARTEMALVAVAEENSDAVSDAEAARAALVLATASLKNAVERGAPFSRELSVLTKFAPETPGLDRLQPYASQGAPSLLALKERFDPTARAAIAAEDREEANSPMDELIASIREVISTRPADAREGDDVRAIVSRAEAALEANDLAAAIDELSVLKGAAAAAFKPWVDDAEAHRIANEALSNLITGDD